MADKSLDELQKRLLRHEEFVAEVLKRRRSESVVKPKWQIFLDSGGTSIVTVFVSFMLTGIVGTVINYDIQKRLSAKQLIAERTKAQSAAQIAQLNIFWSERTRVTNEALELVGKVVARTRELKESFHPRVGTPENVEQNRATRKAFNDASYEWRRYNEVAEFQLSYYLGPGDWASSWHELTDPLNSYVTCVERYTPPGGVTLKEAAEAVDAACSEDDDLMEAALQEFRATLGESFAAWRRVLNEEFQELLSSGAEETSRTSFVQSLAGNTKPLLIVGLLMDLFGALMLAISLLTISDKRALERGISKWSGDTDEKNLGQAQVKDLLTQSRNAKIGVGLLALGFLLQIVAVWAR